MIGGVLVERTVAEVLPALEQNKDQVTNLIYWQKISGFKPYKEKIFQITKFIENLQAQIVEKGKSINEYREKYNIKYVIFF